MKQGWHKVWKSVLQKALDSTLFSGFEGEIRNLWSRSEPLKYFFKYFKIENISAKECIALQKALDSTLFSGFEGAIRHLWSVIWPDCQRPTVMQLHRKSGKKFTLLRDLFCSEWWGNYQKNKISKINFPFFEYILEQTSSEKLWIVYYFKIKLNIPSGS